MDDRAERTGFLDQPVKSWPALVAGLVALVVVLLQALLAVGYEEMRSTVRQNSEALQDIKIALEHRKVTDQRMSAVEGLGKDHEARIRAVEKVR